MLSVLSLIAPIRVTSSARRDMASTGAPPGCTEPSKSDWGTIELVPRASTPSCMNPPEPKVRSSDPAVDSRATIGAGAGRQLGPGVWPPKT